MDLKQHIRSIPDYPKKGILFRDITTLIKNPEAFKYTNDKIIELSRKIDFDKVDEIWGLDIIICTSSKTDAEAKSLLKNFNMPFNN